MTDRIIGPILPEHLKKNSDGITTTEDSICFGPQLPPNLLKSKVIKERESDEEVIGPELPGTSGSTASKALNERAEILKYEFLLKDTNTSNEQKRESWMTELPPEKAVQVGLGPRKFRMSYGTGDKSNRAGWVETPSDKEKKESTEPMPSDQFEDALITLRNEAIDEIVKKSKKSKKDKKSLLEIHREKLKKKEKKKKKKNKKDKPERKPFDRETDLQVNRFDEAQKKAILKKAQLLDTRFSAGKSKYL